MLKKKIGCILLSALLCSSLIAGCGSSGSDSGSGGDSGSSGDKEVTLTRWVTASSQTEAGQRREERFQEKYPHIKLNNVIVAEGTDYITAFASGTNPDIGAVGQPDMAKYAYGGMALALDDYMATWDEREHFEQAILDNFKYNGKYYALASDSYTMQLFYNKALFAEAGIENPPATWDELLETAKKLTKPEKGQWGMNLLLSQWQNWWFEYFVWQAGGDLTKENDDGTIELTFDDPAVETAVDFYRELIAADVIQPDLTLDYENMQNEFSAGHAAMTLIGSGDITRFTQQGMNIDDIGIAELPVGPSGEKVTQLGGNCGFIFSNVSDEVADAAWTWLTFERSKEETEQGLKDAADLGGASPQIVIRDDVDVSLGNVNPEYQAVVDASIPHARLEYYGKGIVGTYVDKAVEKTALDPDADVKAVFQEQQELAQSEAVDSYNQDILESGK